MGNFQREYGESKLIDAYLNEAVAEILRELRKENNLSYSELKNKLKKKVSRQTLNNYELGKTKLRMDMFTEFANVYQLTPVELYEKINNRYISKLSEYGKEIIKGKNKK